jgi:hypothetical protein
MFSLGEKRQENRPSKILNPQSWNAKENSCSFDSFAIKTKFGALYLGFSVEVEVCKT